MAEIREFKTKDVRRVPPIEFKLDGQIFRATGAPSSELVAAVLGVMPSSNNGKRVYSAAILMGAITELVLERIWVDDVDLPDGGRWQSVDDRERMRAILSSDERQIPIEELGELVMYLVGEGIDIPTHALS